MRRNNDAGGDESVDQSREVDDMFSRCPGAAGFAEPVPEPITCPHCGKEVEIFTNEQSMRCYFCGGTVSREKLPTCLDWCKYADICRAEIMAQRRGQGP